jgi:hypothetical protein
VLVAAVCNSSEYNQLYSRIEMVVADKKGSHKIVQSLESHSYLPPRMNIKADQLKPKATSPFFKNTPWNAYD